MVVRGDRTKRLWPVVVLAVTSVPLGGCPGRPHALDSTVEVPDATPLDVQDSDAHVSIDAPTDRDAVDVASGDGSVDAVTPPAWGPFRVCNTPSRDATGGFCDATSLWHGIVEIPIPRFAGQRIVSGVTLTDLDGDGRVDILVTPNDGSPTALFARASGFVSAPPDYFPTTLTIESVAAADLDADGDQDLVLASRDAPVTVWLQVDGRFQATGLAIGPSARDRIALVIWDFDRDGLLDLAFGLNRNPGDCLPMTGIDGCPGSVEFARQRAPLQFESIAVNAPPRFVQGLFPFDWDRDGRDELLVAADFGFFTGGNELLAVRPDGAGSLTVDDVSSGSGFDAMLFGMGVGALDLDGDGIDEVLVSNVGEIPVLRTDRAPTVLDAGYGVLLPGPPPMYRYLDPESSVEGPLARFEQQYLRPSDPEFPTTKWAPVVFDFDDDGVDDVFFPGSAVGIDQFPEPPDQPPLLLHGNGHGLDDVSVANGLVARRDAKGGCAADLDGDGDLDLALVTVSDSSMPGHLVLLRNDASAGRSLVVRARGRIARDGIGASVDVEVGGRVLHRRVDGGLSLLGSGPREVHVGLGSLGAVDRVTVRFPSGATVSRGPVDAGVVVIDEP